MKAEVKWSRGTITAESYPVLCVETGRESHGRDHIVLSMSCSAYEENREAATKELHRIAEAINRDATTPRWHPGWE
jgi:hypothetical protein